MRFYAVVFVLITDGHFCGTTNRKLEEWDDEDNFGPHITSNDRAPPATNKNSRVVVLKYMFTLKELDEDASLLLDLKEDVRDECETLGEVTNVVLYDVGAHPSHNTYITQNPRRMSPRAS